MLVKRNRTPQSSNNLMQSSNNSKQSSNNSGLAVIGGVITFIVWVVALGLSLTHHDKIGYHLAACCCPYLYIIYFIFYVKKHK
jgi:hypothetical protein